MEIKQGDKVRVSKDAPKMYYPEGLDGIVMKIEGEDAFIKTECDVIPRCSPFWILAIPIKYLIKVDTEAKTNTNEEPPRRYTPFPFADRIERSHIQHRMRVISQDDFLKEINPSEHKAKSKPRYIPKIMFNTEYWVKYEADLAHDLAVQMVKCNRNNYDKIGNMAVRIAKSVVENLKQK